MKAHFLQYLFFLFFTETERIAFIESQELKMSLHRQVLNRESLVPNRSTQNPLRSLINCLSLGAVTCTGSDLDGQEEGLPIVCLPHCDYLKELVEITSAQKPQ